MKLQHSVKLKLASALAAGLALSSTLHAQVIGDTYSYFYGASGSTAAAGGATNFDFSEPTPPGFSSLNLLHNTGATYNGGAGLGDGAIGLMAGPNSADRNRASSIWQLAGDTSTLGNNIGTGIDGSTEVVTSVTLWFYINSIGNAPNTPIQLGIYALEDGYTTGTTPGAGPNEAPIGLTQALGTTGWVGIDIPISIALSGFIISAQPGDNSGGAAASQQQVAIYSTHQNSTDVLRPGFALTTQMQIPEPTTTLLGALGSITLLRRRRK